jgi:short-subunit dehydrogenase
MASKFAMITGASRGVGYYLACLAAENEYDLVIAGEDAIIDGAAADLRNYRVDVRAVAADIPPAEYVDGLLAAADGRPVDILCIDASGHPERPDFAGPRRFGASAAMVELLRSILSGMAVRKSGKVLITASVAVSASGFNAERSRAAMLASALRAELAPSRGVAVTALMADTGRDGVDMFHIATDGWEAAMAGKVGVVSGSVGASVSPCSR